MRIAPISYSLQKPSHVWPAAYFPNHDIFTKDALPFRYAVASSSIFKRHLSHAELMNTKLLAGR
jgi:hypothetical protein